jgi:transposase
LKPYSHDIRVRVIQSYENGEGSQRQLARRYSVSLSFVQHLIKRYRQTGNIFPIKHSNKVAPKIDYNSLQLILKLVDNNPELPLSRLCERLAEERQLHISKATMWRTLRKHRPHKRALRLPTDNSSIRMTISPPS